MELGSGGIEEVHIGGLFIKERSEEQLRLLEPIDVATLQKGLTSKGT